MTKTLLLSSVSALALCVGVPSFAGSGKPVAAFSAGEATQSVWASPGYTKLYSQNDNDAGIGVDSQNFSSGDFTTYNSAGADDFVIPSGHKWKIKEVDVTGVYFNGPGPAASENVVFYRDSQGLPGDRVAECDNLKGTDYSGSFAITIPKTCRVNLRGGRTYWVSVIANEALDSNGQWAWETRTHQNGNPAVWENPEDGFHSGCTSWNYLPNCVADEPDFMFALTGKDVIL